MKVCKNCGTQLSDDLLFCVKCGTRLDSDMKPTDDDATSVGTEGSIEERTEDKTEEKTMDGIGVEPSEPEIPNDKPEKVRRKSIPLVLAVIILLVAVTGFFCWRVFSKSVIDLNSYYTTSFSGYDGYGVLSGDILIDSFEKDNKKLGKKGDFLLLSGLLLTGSYDKTADLHNGDTVTLHWNISEGQKESIEETFGCKLVYEDETFSVSGLKEVETFDLFSTECGISEKGFDGYGTIELSVDPESEFEFSFDESEDLHNGDIVSIEASFKNSRTTMETYIDNHGVAPKKMQLDYTVSQLQPLKEVDVFEGVTVKTVGASPFLDAFVDTSRIRPEIGNLISYEVDDSGNGFANGDTVSVIAVYDEEEVGRNGYKIITDRSQFAIAGAGEYWYSGSEVDFSRLRSEMNDYIVAETVSHIGDRSSDLLPIEEHWAGNGVSQIYLINDIEPVKSWTASIKQQYDSKQAVHNEYKTLYKVSVSHRVDNTVNNYDQTQTIYCLVSAADIIINPDGSITWSGNGEPSGEGFVATGQADGFETMVQSEVNSLLSQYNVEEIEKSDDLASSGSSDKVAESSDNGQTAFYGIWISASKKKSDSEDIVADVISKGFDGYVIYSPDWAELNREPFYCVTAGKYATESEADTHLKDVKAKGYNSAYVKYSGAYMGV